MRPPAAPIDPEMMHELHSTKWDADLSEDKEAMHTHRVLQWQRFAWIPHMAIIPGLCFLWIYYQPTGDWTFEG